MKPGALKISAGIKIAIGVVAGIVVVIGGFLLVQNVFTKASDTAPRDLIISTITTNTATISWTTDQESQGVVEYGSSPTALNLFSPENAKLKSHSVVITLLSPATSYYFQIRIGETKYDNGGVPWTFSTKVQQAAAAAGTGTPIPLSPSPISLSPGATNPVPTESASAVTPTSGSAFGPLKSSSLQVNPVVATPTKAPALPTPTAYVLPTMASYVCGVTDCQALCQKIGISCSTQDWTRSGCTGKVLLGSCFLVIPTATPTITPTPTATPTPTHAP